MGNKINSIDVYKFFFAISVVVMHGFMLKLKNTTDFNVGFFINGIFRTAVPFFYIVSGYLFSKSIKKGSSNRWLVHILKLYIIWSIIYSYTLTPIIELTTEGLTRKAYLILRTEMTGTSHLWFLPSLLMSAILIKPLHHKIQKKPISFIIYSVFLWSTGCLIQVQLVEIGSMNSFLYRNFIFFALPMMIVGIIIEKKEDIINNHIKNNELAIIVAASVALCLIESIVWTHFFIENKGAALFSAEMIFSALILSPVLFLICIKNNKIRSNSLDVRLTSSFMYFSHVIILDLTSKIIITLSNTEIKSSLTNVFTTLFTITTVIFLSRALGPHLKRIT